jgi:hypothetical protein
MSCIPQTPIANRYLDSGWVTPVTPIDTTNTMGVGEPLYAEIITVPNVATTTNESGKIHQIHIEETASSGANIKKHDLLVLVWTRATSAPTTPTLNTVYNPSTTNYIGAFPIVEANYVRWSDTVYTATIKPDHIFKSGTDAVATDFHIAIVSNESGGITYTSPASMRVRIVTEPAA